MSAPVTVSITRHIEPEHAAEMVAWVRAGASLAERFDGFLGFGWVRPGADSDEWHMLYRFADAASLAMWEASSQRQWWLDAAQGRIGESHVERRTGIEGWFDEPTSIEDLSKPAAPPPPRWKQGTVIWLAFFPLSVLIAWLVTPHLSGIPLVLRVLCTTVLMTPLMVYAVLPVMTRWMSWWLHGQPPPWRR